MVARLSADEAQKRWDALDQYPTIWQAAEALGMAASTLVNWQRNNKRPDPAIVESMAAVGTNLTPVLAWAKTKSEDGTSYSVLLKPEQPGPESAAERLVEIFAGIPAAPPIIRSEKTPDGKTALLAQTDVHIGAVISADHGGKEYSPDIAMERMRDGFAAHHAAMPPRETTIILDNGDLTHSNDDRDVTFKSEHRLKVSGSYQSNLILAVTAKAWQIDLALQTSDRVIYRSNRGNHDPSTPAGVFAALSQRYRNEPRVTIDGSERKTWVYQRGHLFLSAHHGDGIKPEKLCAHLPTNFPAEFGASRHWYFITGHLHEAKQATFGGIHWFQLPSICPMDQNSSDMGYSDNSAMRSFLFCERGGLRDDFTTRF